VVWWPTRGSCTLCCTVLIPVILVLESDWNHTRTSRCSGVFNWMMRRRRPVNYGTGLTIALWIHKTFNQVVREMHCCIDAHIFIHLCCIATDSSLIAKICCKLTSSLLAIKTFTSFEISCCMAELVGTSSVRREPDTEIVQQDNILLFPYLCRSRVTYIATPTAGRAVHEAK
jgi:hypothetical protein